MPQKTTILFSILIGCLIQSANSSDLVLRKLDNSIRVVLSEQGDLRSNVSFEPQVNPITPQSGSFVFRNLWGDDIKVAVTSEHFQIKRDLVKNNLNKAFVSDLAIHTVDLPSEKAEQAIIGSTITPNDGDFKVRGGSGDVSSPVAATYYMDGDGVFEQYKVGEGPEFAYANITTPMGIEGRTAYKDGAEQANYYYVRDHLGSVRMTVDENGDQQENVLYTAYGMQKDLRVSSEEPARERFTGKELDHEGEIHCEVNLNVTVEGVSVISPGSYFQIAYEDGSVEQVPFELFIIITPPSSGSKVQKSFRYNTTKRITQLNYTIVYDPGGGQHTLNGMVTEYATIECGTMYHINGNVTITELAADPNRNFYANSSTDLPAASEGIAYCYFGKRYYDPDVGMWTSPDQAGQYWNSYCYTGGNPVTFFDNNGDVAIYVNGVNGEDNQAFRQYLGSMPLFGGTYIDNKQASFHGQDYGLLRDVFGANHTCNQIGDLALAASGLGAIYAPLLQFEYEDAFEAAVQKGEPFYVVAHSGGAGAGGFATGIFNLTHGYGTVSHQYNINGFDAMGMGTGFAEWTGTQVTSFYTITDPISWLGSSMDVVNPFTLLTDPGKNLQTIDPFQWGLGNNESGTFLGHCGGTNSAIGNFYDFGNVFSGKTVGSEMLKGAGVYGLLTGDFTPALTLLGEHYGTKLLRDVMWYSNPLNWFHWQ